MVRANSVSLLRYPGRLLSVVAATGLVAFLSIALPQPASAATITAQGAVTALTNASEMGLSPHAARFDEAGVSPGDPIPLDLYSGAGLTFAGYGQPFAVFGIQDRSGTTTAVDYWTDGGAFSPPIAGGGSQTGLICRSCGVASLADGPTRFGLTASDNDPQYLTVWDTSGYIIGQVTWAPTGSSSAFVGLDTGSVPIGFVAYGNDDVWNGETYTYSGSITYSDTWLWPSLCTNGVVDPGEQCDDGNVDAGDCCDAGCQYEGDGSACNADPAACEVRTCDGAGTCVTRGDVAPGTPCEADASVCTIDQCDAAGNCLHNSDLDCADTDPCTQDSCLAASGCLNSLTPATGCNTAQVASLMLSNPFDVTKKRATFVWAKGTSALAAFGDIATTAYTLCVYHPGGLVTHMSVEPASTCGTLPCWKMLGTAGKEKGVLYKDKRKVPGHDGVKLLLGKADDGVAGKAVVKLVALDEEIPPITMDESFGPPVTAQILTNNAACWTAEFPDGSESRNDGVLYKAKVKTP